MSSPIRRPATNAGRATWHDVSPDGRDASPVRRGAFAVGVHVAGATPVDPDEAADLIPTGIETVDHLNAFEQTNILSATEWARRHRRRHTPATVLSEGFLFDLHRRMFDQTWRWAGVPRRTDKNIGVHWPTIRVAMRERVKDAELWLAESVFPVDEVAVRGRPRTAAELARMLLSPAAGPTGRLHESIACPT